MADIFDEVDEDLRAERARRWLVRYGALAVLAAILVVVGAAGWQGWRWYQDRRALATATVYLTAMRDAGTPGHPGDTAAARAALQQVIATGPQGYTTLSRLWAAALDYEAGKQDAARALWDQVAGDDAADPLLRGLANLMWVTHQIDTGDPAALKARLAMVLDPTSPWHALAAEAQALILLRQGDTGGAKQALNLLAQDPTAPQGVRARAGGLLARLGG